MELVLATLLGPLLPYLLSKTDESAGRAVEAVGSAAWDRAKTIWRILWPKVEAKEGARDVVETLAENPGDEAARGAFQFQLRKILESDSTLAQEVGVIVRQAQRAGILADNGAVVIGGDVTADRGGVAGGRDVIGGQGGIHTRWQQDE